MRRWFDNRITEADGRWNLYWVHWSGLVDVWRDARPPGERWLALTRLDRPLPDAQRIAQAHLYGVTYV